MYLFLFLVHRHTLWTSRGSFYRLRQRMRSSPNIRHQVTTSGKVYQAPHLEWGNRLKKKSDSCSVSVWHEWMCEALCPTSHRLLDLLRNTVQLGLYESPMAAVRAVAARAGLAGFFVGFRYPLLFLPEPASTHTHPPFSTAKKMETNRKKIMWEW